MPRYSGRLDGAYLGGTNSLEHMWIETGTTVATTLIAQHPYVEWRQRTCRTHSWQSSPVVFAALRKVRVRIGVRAMWSREAVEGVAVVVDLQTVPRPPPPPPPAWEWCECANAYARRLLVCTEAPAVSTTHCFNTALWVCPCRDGAACAEFGMPSAPRPFVSCLTP